MHHRRAPVLAACEHQQPLAGRQRLLVRQLLVWPRRCDTESEAVTERGGARNWKHEGASGA